jgi:hypothetical protein
VKALGWKGLGVAALVAAVLVPTASASSAARVKMSLLPLQQAQLGSVAKSLQVEPGSGVVTNADAAGNSWRGSPRMFKKIGRITGYALQYGDARSGDAGVTEIYTEVSKYKTASGAKKGLAFWKKDDPRVTLLNQGGFTVTSKAAKVPAVGRARFGDLISYSAANIVPLYNLDEQFTDGRYELDVSVSAGSAAGATQLAPKLAKKLDKRLRQALAGKLHAKPVKVPGPTPAGPPAGGPDISTLALQTSDFTGTATVQDARYYPTYFALSHYSLVMEPAGPFDILFQDILWYPTANEAAFWADWDNAYFLSSGGSQVDLSSVGDGAQGVLDPAGFVQVVFSSGQLNENIFGLGESLQASDVQSLAQSAANYINNAGLGS